MKNNRKIVMDTGALHLLGSDEKVFKHIKEAGFDYYDYTLFWKGETEHIGVGDDFREKAKEVRKLADSIGLKCAQSHAYFTSGASEESINRRIEYICKDIESASILGAECIVIHPIMGIPTERNIQIFKDYFVPLAHKFNIKIAVENVWDVINNEKAPMCTSRPDDFVYFIDSFEDEYVGACCDIGHAELNQLSTSAPEIIKALGPRLIALHIHDVDKWGDSHQIPYTQKINFSKVLDALREINYKGNITFEVETCYSRGEDPTASLPFELYPAFLKLEYEIGKYFLNYLEK